jgi:hypothetical protein
MSERTSAVSADPGSSRIARSDRGSPQDAARAILEWHTTKGSSARCVVRQPVRRKPTHEPDPVLVAFGDLTAFGATLTAEYIFSHLMSARRWFVMNPRRCLVNNARLLFYEKRRGFAGTALAVELSRGTDRDVDACPGLPIRLFSHSVLLDQICVFPHRLDCRPLVGRLGFITNKKSWGLAFMGTPRSIPEEDYQTILKQGLR